MSSTGSAAAASAAAMSSASATASSPNKTALAASRAAKKAAAAAAAAVNSTSGVLDYLRTILPRSTLLQLYTEESRGRFVCRAILQQISCAAQQVVVRLSCTGGCFSLTGIKVWTKCNRNALESQALETILLDELEKWAIIEPMAKQRAIAAAANAANADSASAAASSPVMVRLTEEFQIGLRASMSCLEASPWTAIPPDQLELLLSQQPPPTAQQLQLLSKRSTSPTPPKRARALNNNKQSSSSPPQLQQLLLHDANAHMTPEDLERYTQDVWDAVLHFLVGTVGTTEPPKAVVHFLLQTGLMQVDPDEMNNSNTSNGGGGAGSGKLKVNKKYDDSSPLVITEKGYDFMLQDNHEQVWHFVVQYLNVIASTAPTPEKGQKKVREALLLLICLSYCRVGQAYPASALTKSGRRMLRDLAHFGLLYVRELVMPMPAAVAGTAAAPATGDPAALTEAPNSQIIFYPTRVATQLLGSANASASSGGAHDSPDDDTMPTVAGGNVWSLSSKALNAALAQPDPRGSSHLAIIVQTNFQVCAYTTSELHISMLGLFCDVQTIRRLPNVVFMAMTRNSVKSAFAFGITARQILRFLEKHAHPKLRDPNTMTHGGTGTGSPLPSNVVDQVWLWDREQTRVTFTEVAVHQCLMPGEFGAVLDYASRLGSSGGSSSTGGGGACSWSSERRQQILVNYAYVEKIQDFVRQWRAEHAAAAAGR